MRSVLDQAFLRRIQTIVTFAYPDRAAWEAERCVTLNPTEAYPI